MGLRISESRLLADLRELARIGGRADGGVDRTAGSPADLEARKWLQRKIADAGLTPRTDAINNVFGRLGSSQGPWLLVGSHTDTVPGGGWLDGAYGVVAALEVLRTLAEAQHPAAAVVEVVSFHDEEGTGPGGGVAGSRYLVTRPHVEELRGYLEIHIEQGPRLEAEHQDLGVVLGIVGMTQLSVEVRGEANHAGTTAFELRRDSGLVLARLWVELEALARSIDPAMVATIGSVQLEPGAANVVPGVARFTIDFRAPSEDSLREAGQRLESRIHELSAEGGCTAALAVRHSLKPTPMHPRMVAVLSNACRLTGRPWAELWSGAGHDAGVLASRVPAGMLFVPSRRGVSHSPREDSPETNLVLGAQVLLEAVVEASSA